MLYIFTIAILVLNTVAYSAEETNFKFEPFVGNATRSLVSSQEVELGSNLFNSIEAIDWEKPSSVFDERTKYLPKDIKVKAWAHFAQKDYKGTITVQETHALATLYKQQNTERIKKENPKLYALLSKPVRDKTDNKTN